MDLAPTMVVRYMGIAGTAGVVGEPWKARFGGLSFD
jgi:hypothetical protein